MPGEYEPHRGCNSDLAGTAGILANGAREAKKHCRRNPGNCKSEEVYLAASGKKFSEAEKLAQRLQTDEALYPIRFLRQRPTMPGPEMWTNLCDGWTGSKGNQLGV